MSKEYQYTEKKFGDLLYYYILASREDQIVRWGEKEDPHKNSERFINLQRHTMYKEKQTKYINIKTESKQIMSYLFSKMIFELQSAENIEQLDNISFTRKQEITLRELSERSKESHDILANKYKLKNTWKLLVEVIEETQPISIISFMYTIAKEASTYISELSMIITVEENKKYFKQKIEQLLQNKYSDDIQLSVYKLLDVFIRCLCDIINRHISYDHVSLKKTTLLGILNSRYISQEILNEIEDDLEQRNKKNIKMDTPSPSVNLPIE